MGVISKSGTWFSYGDIRLGQGREKARQFLKENRDMTEEMAGVITKAASVVAPKSSAGFSGEE